MDNERVIIIGDIHGCLDMLKRLLDKIEWDPNRDHLIFLGDYIDRGENPKGVIDFILALKRCSNHIECLVGNHEILFLNYLDGKDRELFLLNQGWSTLESYELDKPEEGQSLVPDDHLAFYKTLKSYIQLDGYYVVHAGFRPGVDIKKQSLNDLTWIRDAFIYSDYDFGKKVIFGHTPFQEPLVIDNKIGLDTGAVFGNKLTCLELPEFRFHSVEPKLL